MSKLLPILAIVLLGAVAGSGWASRAGLGLPQPAKKPLSLREASLHRGRAGHHGTRYFVGGGPRYGK